MCSDHFIDGQLTLTNPLPTLKLGYNVTQQLGHIPPARRVLKRQSSVPASQSTCQLISTTQSLDAKEQHVEISNDQDMTTGDLFSNVESFSMVEMKPIAFYLLTIKNVYYFYVCGNTCLC